MACWRVLSLGNSSSEAMPQLLFKVDFGKDNYTLFLTDLSNIWSEALDLGDIVKRAVEVDSPIEVRKQDTTQLTILLENIHKSLARSDETECHMTRGDAESVTIHSVIRLPEPLDALRWRFNLEKRTPVTLKNELILPLLVSSHIQHDRMNKLASIVNDKDKAITRLLDQYESSHLDLASAFPSIGGNKPGRRVIKREQAAKHIPALQPFPEKQWMQETSQLQEPDLCTLELFQEALSECSTTVPTSMKTEDVEHPWWSSISTTLDRSTSKPKRRGQKPPVKAPPPEEEDGSETEDEFETHENFKLREPLRPKVIDNPVAEQDVKQEECQDGDSTDDDEDLDAPPKSQSQSQNQATSPPRRLPTRERSPVAEASPSPSPAPSPEPEPTKTTDASTSRPKTKGFKIGGPKTKRTTEETSKVDNTGNAKDEEIPDAPIVQSDVAPKRKTFKIGGKRKEATESVEASLPPPSSSQKRAQDVKPLPREKTVEGPVEEAQEETAEEKAERKRSELKRKNEELAKKQTLKKKKRF